MKFLLKASKGVPASEIDKRVEDDDDDDEVMFGSVSQRSLPKIATPISEPRTSPPKQGSSTSLPKLSALKTPTNATTLPVALDTPAADRLVSDGILSSLEGGEGLYQPNCQ